MVIPAVEYYAIKVIKNMEGAVKGSSLKRRTRHIKLKKRFQKSIYCVLHLQKTPLGE